jgi:uncharacterized membrane protein YdbT with pleckstrin-like domain
LTELSPIEIRPSIKLLYPLYALAVLLALGIITVANNQSDDRLRWLLIAPGIILLVTIAKHLRLKFTKLTVGAGKLRYETGMLSRSTRTMEIHKVQDVRVDQSLGQRMLGTGNISIETAGESSRLTMANIDRPHIIADKILEAAKPI